MSQFWAVPLNDTLGTHDGPWPSGYLHDAGEGLCVGCDDYFGKPCANDALTFHNGSGYGLASSSDRLRARAFDH